jgi:hypothetical protein
LCFPSGRRAGGRKAPLAVHGEYYSAGQGIVRYDRRTNTLTRFDIGDSIGRAFVVLRDRILLAAATGSSSSRTAR